MKKSKVILFNGILLMVATIFALVLAEVAVRVVAPRQTATAQGDRYGLAMHSAGVTAYLPQFGHEVTINSHGMRDVEHEFEKADGTYRILILGDSFMEAYQVLLDESLPRLVEADLNAAGRRVEVINGGVSGWGTEDQLRYLQEYGLEYDPDLVLVVMTLHNDVSDNLRQFWNTLENGELVTLEKEPVPFLRYASLQLKAFLGARLQIVQVWREFTHRGEVAETSANLIAHTHQIFRDPPSERIEFGFQLTDRLLERVHDVAEANGAEMAIAMIPLVYQLSDSAFAEHVDKAELSMEDMTLLQPQNHINATAERLGVPVIDLLPGFAARVAESSEPLYIEWDGHWNAAGHRLAADIVSAGLLETGLIR